METTYRIPGTEIIHELLDNEVIIANLDSGVYYSIRESGIPVWQMLLSQHSLNEISAIIAQKYTIKEHDITAPLQAFINQLLEEGLIEISPSEHSKNRLDSSLIWPAVFKKPGLEKYEEMKNLLMLDPIHEVDEQGWPHASA